MTTPNFATLLQNFFTRRLMQQKQVSPHTVASYRDTFRLLLRFAEQRLKKPPSRLSLDEIDAPFIGTFLHDLEKTRGIVPRSRNLRLTAIRSFFHFAAFEAPDHSAMIQRVLAIPGKRYTRKQVHFLTRAEAAALLAVPDQKTWSGRRDHALLLVALQTGLRVSELTSLQHQDIVFGPGAHVRVTGKGRKERCTPITKQTASVLRMWMRRHSASETATLFPNARGGRLSADGVQYILSKHLDAARQRCGTLQRKHVTPHVLRHTTAMELLQAGVDRTVIALWLGHESIETTQIYLEANLSMKEAALAKTSPNRTAVKRYRPEDAMLTFLKNL
jgi:site-specific recombinase XerD